MCVFLYLYSTYIYIYIYIYTNKDIDIDTVYTHVHVRHHLIRNMLKHTKRIPNLSAQGLKLCRDPKTSPRFQFSGFGSCSNVRPLGRPRAYTGLSPNSGFRLQGFNGLPNLHLTPSRLNNTPGLRSHDSDMPGEVLGAPGLGNRNSRSLRPKPFATNRSPPKPMPRSVLKRRSRTSSLFSADKCGANGTCILGSAKLEALQKTKTL